ncbi:MAG TPA: LysM domain-containing protein [Solirubrobacteraceae bacterium]
MPRRSPARWLAPLAVLTVTAVMYTIVMSSSGDQSAASQRSADAPAKPAGKRIYRVRRGDTLSSISIRTDVPLSTLHRLNPAADSFTLQPGQPIKLRPIRR